MSLPLLSSPVAGGVTRWIALPGWISLALLVVLSPVAQADAPPRLDNSIAQRVQACIGCHGKEGRATRDGYFPRIAGKPADYLYNQLINFREGRRQYPQMTYMVAHLSDVYLREIAGYFSQQHPPYPPPASAAMPSAVMERGRMLVFKGDPARKLPACVACHGERLTGLLPSVPGLVGLPRDYLNAQFGAWRNGMRRAAAPDCMASISKQLTTQDIEAVSTWLAAQPLPGNMRPGLAHSVKLPVSCGSVPQ